MSTNLNDSLDPNKKTCQDPSICRRCEKKMSDNTECLVPHLTSMTHITGAIIIPTMRTESGLMWACDACC